MSFQPLLFQPFSPWNTPRRQISSPPQPSPSTPQLNTPRELWDESHDKERRMDGTPVGRGGGMGFTPLDYQIRRPLDEVHHNALIPPRSSHAPIVYVTPYFSNDPNGVWGPPLRHAPERLVSVEQKLAQAEAKIRELSLENNRLRDRVPSYPQQSPRVLSNSFTSPSLSTSSSMFFDAYSTLGYSSNNDLGMRFEDEEAGSQRTRRGSGDGESSDNSASYIPPQHMVYSILTGSFNYADMHPDYIRPIVWIVAHRQPRNNSESAGLKTAVNALAARLGLPRETDAPNLLVNAIIEWAKPLCFTSCGNYLCQQLLERGEVEDKRNFITEIQEDLVDIASDKFGTHVLCKAVAVKELEEPIAEALLKAGIFESLRTGARRLWREYLEKCRQAKEFDIFDRINIDMEGKWADLACINEHGSIAVQQVFEVFGSPELMDPCFQELLIEISRISNNQYGHFVVTKLIGYPNLYRTTCDAILVAYPPVATTHHGVNFAKTALTEGGRAAMIRYVDAICSQDEGRTPGIVAIATSSIGKAHLTFVLSCLTPSEHIRVRQVCRSFSTTLRNSQSGNDLLRSLGLIHAIGSRHRNGSN